MMMQRIVVSAIICHDNVSIETVCGLDICFLMRYLDALKAIYLCVTCASHVVP